MLLGAVGMCEMFGGVPLVGALGDWWNRLVAEPQVEKVKSSRSRSLRALQDVKIFKYLYGKVYIPTNLKSE